MVKIRTILAVVSLASAALGYLPLVAYLDMLPRILFPLALILGIYLDRHAPPRRALLLTLLSLGFFVFYGARFSLNSIVPVTANLLVCLLSVRLLSEKNGRNYLQIFALSLFCLAASSLYNLSGTFLLYLVLLLVLLAVSLVLLTFHAHDPELLLDRANLKRVLGTALLLPAASLPIMLVLFVIMPRTQYPLWNFLGGETSVVGFTDKVRPGASSTVAAASTPAFRALCAKVPQDLLYWRGIVLNGFSGDTWVRLEPPPELLVPRSGQPTVRQTIYPEPSRTPYLPALNFPLFVGGVRRSAAPDLVFAAGQGTARRMSYDAVSALTGSLRTRKEIDRGFYLTLPEHLPPRLAAAAREIGATAGSPAEAMKLLERFFRTRKLSYATAGLPQGKDPLDQFLFEKRRGNCEFFASAAALMLRVAGTPARLVGGYHGGVYSETGGYYLVTDDMAHVWVEAFVEGRGWVTVDPSGWALDFGRFRPGVGSLRLYLDALGFYWNKAVVTYDLDKQISLFRGAGAKLSGMSMPRPSPRRLLPFVVIAVALAALWALFMMPRRTPSQRLLRRFLQAVQGRYPHLDTANCGIIELARTVHDPLIAEFVSLYGGALYRDQSLSGADLHRLGEIVRMLRRRS